MQEQQPLLDGRYQVIKQLGEGAFARTYLVKDALVKQQDFLVVKQFKQPTSRTQAIKEFEVRLQLFNPRKPDPACQHLPWIHEVHPVDHEAHVIMDYVPGPTLKEVDSEFPWPIEEWWSFAQSLLSVLELLEKHHLLHRDIKPENIILHKGDRRQPVLIDFGFATPRSVTTTGAGTPGYLPPELWASSRPPESSDRYALSVVLFQILTGREPVYQLAKDGYTRIVRMPPSIDKKVRPLAKVLLTAIATDPAKRPRSASELRERLEEALKGIPQKDKPPLPELSPTRDELPSTPTSPVEPVDSPKREPPANRASRKPKSTQESRDRRWMLAKVRSFWIHEILEESLHGAALITPGLRAQRDAVANPSVTSPRRLILQQENQSSSALPSGTHITQVFDKVNSALLILGEPGSGKTTLLLELARDLLDRAQKNTKRPIPVVFNLSSWAVKRQPLIQWLIEELHVKYQIPAKIGLAWVDADQLLLLLDGLDEVASEHREACIDAINEYRRNHGQVPIVVCSRITEYMQSRLGLLLQSAVVVQPLTREQIKEYLISGGEQLAGVRKAFDEDKELQELATTPLMLSIITLAYAGIPAEQLSLTGSQAARRKQVFATYVQRQLSTRPAGLHYTEQQSVHWLSWLAQQLVKQKQTEFYLERMQLDGWLVKSRPAEIYTSLALALLTFLVAFIVLGLEYTFGGIGFALINGTLVGLLGALVAFFFVWIIEADFHLFPGAKKRQEQPEVAETSKKRSKLAAFFTPVFWERAGFAVLCGAAVAALVQFLVGPLYALNNGLFVAAFLVILGRFDRIIQPAERLIWSWKSFFKNAVPSLLIGLGFGTLGGIFDAYPYFQQRPVFLATMYFWWSLGGAFGIVIMLVRGLTNKEIDKRQKAIKPNQGIRNSLSNSLKVGISSGTLIGIVIFFFYSYVMHKVFIVGYINEIPANSDVIYGVGDMVTILYLFWLINGGFATVQHLMLRIRLWQIRCIPWRYPRFLDYATERIFLNRVGGGYMFVHKLLLEYFADLGMEEGLSPTPAESQQPEKAHSTLAKSSEMAMHQSEDEAETVSVGATIEGKYKIDYLAGWSDHSQIFKAWEIPLERYVAIKVMLPDARASTNEKKLQKDRLTREALILAGLEHHSYIVPIYTALPQFPAIVMPWYEHTELSLESMIRDENDIPLPWLVTLGMQLADALDHIHCKGVTHRDLKPANILLNKKQEPVLIDFDIARASNVGTVTRDQDGKPFYVGTASYSAPEQLLLGAEVGPYTDIFALGVVLYQAQTLQFPFQYGNNPASYRDGLLPTPERADMPAPLYEILCGTLNQNPGERPQAKTLQEQLRTYLHILEKNF